MLPLEPLLSSQIITIISIITIIILIDSAADGDLPGRQLFLSLYQRICSFNSPFIKETRIMFLIILYMYNISELKQVIH